MNIEDILAKHQGTAPVPPTQRDKKDLIMRFLFGLAGGASQGGRGFGRGVGDTLAGAGAGGLEQIIGANAEDAEAQQEYEKAYQQYKKEALGLEIELKQKVREEKMIIENLKYSDRIDEMKFVLEQTQPAQAFSDVNGITLMWKNGKTTFMPKDMTELQALEYKNLKYQMSVGIGWENMQPAMRQLASNFGIEALDANGNMTQEFIIFNSAIAAALGGATTDQLNMAQKNVFEKNPDLQNGYVKQEEAAIIKYEQAMVIEFLLIYAQNPDWALATQLRTKPEIFGNEGSGGLQ